MQEIRSGGLIDELSTDLESLIDSVKKVRKGGTLTLKLTITPMGKGEVTMVSVEDDIILKKPRVRPQKLFYPTEENGLSTRDPRQKEFDLTVVEGTKQEPVKLSETATKVG